MSSSRLLRLLPLRGRVLHRFSGALCTRWCRIGWSTDLGVRLRLPLPRSTDLLTRLRGLAGLALARSSRQDLPHWRSRLVLGFGGASEGDRGLDHGNSLTKVRERRPDHVDVVALNRLVERRPLDLKTSGLRLAEVAGDGSASGDQCLGVCGGVAPDPREATRPPPMEER